VPLRSAQTQSVVGGLVIRPRFESAGVGRVLHETGWAAAPEFLDLSLVPGSGREIPPSVLAGPVISRLAENCRRTADPGRPVFGFRIACLDVAAVEALKRILS
jgi:hypothetical protein